MDREEEEEKQRAELTLASKREANREYYKKPNKKEELEVEIEDVDEE